MTTSQLFYADGALLRGELITGTPSQIMDAVFAAVEPGGLPAHLPRYERRLSLAILVATELQSRLLQEALDSGTASFETLSDSDVERLTAPKSMDSVRPAPWTNTVIPLVVIPEEGNGQVPEGVVVALPVRSDLALIAGLVGTGMITAGLLS